MGKISYEDKARIEILWQLGFGYRTIVAKFPEKGWKLCSVKAICDERESATERKPGSGRFFKAPQKIAKETKGWQFCHPLRRARVKQC